MLRLGQWRYPWGKVIAIGMLSGERYYWFENGWGDIAMMPAIAVIESSTDGDPVRLRADRQQKGSSPDG